MHKVGGLEYTELVRLVRDIVPMELQLRPQ